MKRRANAVRYQSESTLQMIAVIRRFPDRLFSARTRDQEVWLKDRKNFWYWMGLRLDYLQLEQMGFRPLDPLDNPDLDPRQREYLGLFSSHLFQILQVIIKGFSFIKDAAIHEGRNFPFYNPRELFIEICRDWADFNLEAAASIDIEQGRGLNEVRDAWTTMSKFYRGRKREDYTGLLVHKDELIEEQILADLKKGDWFGFWQFAIFEHRFKELRLPFKEFLKTHKSLGRFINETKPKNGTTLSHNESRSLRADP